MCPRLDFVATPRLSHLSALTNGLIPNILTNFSFVVCLTLRLLVPLTIPYLEDVVVVMIMLHVLCVCV